MSSFQTYVTYEYDDSEVACFVMLLLTALHILSNSPNKTARCASQFTLKMETC
jgi:hypothetical protein